MVNEHEQVTIVPEIIQAESIATWTQELGGIPSFLKESLQTFSSQVVDSQENPWRSPSPTDLAEAEELKRRVPSLSKIRQLLAENDLTDSFLITVLKDIITSATKANPKTGQPEVDYPTILEAVKFLAKLNWLWGKESQIMVNVFNSNSSKFW